jgi:hypothetical protein
METIQQPPPQARRLAAVYQSSSSELFVKLNSGAARFAPSNSPQITENLHINVVEKLW